jgi:RNA polymerase sigma-70 factor (ECF subfamily)
MFDNPRRLRRPEERVGNVTNADLPPPALQQDDAFLTARIRARDESVFEQLFDRHYPAMLRVAMAYVRSAEEAEEVIQETWIAVISGIHKFEARSSFKTWMFRILINRARSRARREARSIPWSAISADARADGIANIAAPSVWAPAHARAPASPEQAVLDGELHDVVERAVASLPRLQRMVISLRDIEGWSADEVCASLNVTAGNQRVLLHRARMRVRELISPYLEVEPMPA